MVGHPKIELSNQWGKGPAFKDAVVLVGYLHHRCFHMKTCGYPIFPRCNKSYLPKVGGKCFISANGSKVRFGFF